MESILEMGESCPLIFKSWFASELETGWNKIIWLGRDFTRVVYDNEMVMSLGVNSRSAQSPLGVKHVLPGAFLHLVHPRTVKILDVVMAA